MARRSHLGSPYTYTGTSRLSVAAEAIAWLRRRRVIVTLCSTLTQMVGVLLLFVADQIAGLHVAAVAMVAAMTLMISGAWLLLVGVAMREPKPFDRSP